MASKQLLKWANRALSKSGQTRNRMALPNKHPPYFHHCKVSRNLKIARSDAHLIFTPVSMILLQPSTISHHACPHTRLLRRSSTCPPPPPQTPLENPNQQSPLKSPPPPPIRVRRFHFSPISKHVVSRHYPLMKTPSLHPPHLHQNQRRDRLAFARERVAGEGMQWRS